MAQLARERRVPPAGDAARALADRVDVDFARAEGRVGADADRARAADAGLGEIEGMLGEVRELVAEGGRQVAVDAVLADVNRVAGSAAHGGRKLLDGSAAVRGVALPAADAAHLGGVRQGSQTYRVGDLRTGGALAGVRGGLATAVVDSAVAQVGRVRAALGAGRPVAPNRSHDPVGARLDLIA
jgi:flagellin-like hook-associated protein FlgL